MTSDLSDTDYAALAEFRFALRRFQVFSEAKAAEAGLTPQQHQALRGDSTWTLVGSVQ